jgi:serine/threonine protein kinase
MADASLLNTLGRPRFLCDSKFTDLVQSGEFTIESLRYKDPQVPAPVAAPAAVLGEGSFGVTVSAEITVVPTPIALNEAFPKIVGTNNSRKDLSCTAALKISKTREIRSIGMPHDILVESSIYSRTSQKKGIAKAIFMKFSDNEVKTVMEHYIINLSSLIKKLGGLKRNLVRAIAFQIANGLHLFHEENICHKDLKLENILLGHDGRVFITDFGLSTYMIVDASEPKDFYMRDTTATIVPPERFTKEAIGKPFDMWGFGVCLVNLIFFRPGQGPMYDFYRHIYNGDDWDTTFLEMRRGGRMDWVYRQYSQKTEAILAEIVKLDPEIASLLSHLLVNKQEDRYTTAQVLADPLFSGLTLEIAEQITRDELGLNPKISRNILSVFDSIKKYEPATGTYITNAPNKNMSTASFFQIKPSQQSLGRSITWTGEINPTMKGLIFNYLLELSFTDLRVPLYSIIHGIELLERFIQKKQIKYEYLQSYGMLSVYIADKVSPISNWDSSLELRDLVYISANPLCTKDLFIANEIEIITLLNGDLFPQKGGFTDLFLNVYMKGVPDNKKVFRFTLAFLSYSYFYGNASLVDFFNAVDMLYEESGEAVTPMPKNRGNDIRPAIKDGIKKRVNKTHLFVRDIYNTNTNINTVLSLPAGVTLLPTLTILSYEKAVNELPIAHA